MAITEEHTELIDRVWEEAIEKGEMAVVDEPLASDYVLHTPASPEPIRGPEGLKQYKRTLREAFPDMSVTIEDRVVGEDSVVDRYRMRGTHEGEFNGVAPTGTEVEFTGIIHYLEDGKVVEFDLFGLMHQLGVVESPGE
jgi:predicted ester cyclase